MVRRIKVQVEERWYEVQLDNIRTNPVRVLVDGEPVEVEVEGLPSGREPDTAATTAVSASTPMGPVTVVRAPMLGVIVSVEVSVNQSVASGDTLYVLEAIKLQQSIRAPVAGVVRAVHVQPGQNVTAGQAIVDLG